MFNSIFAAFDKDPESFVRAEMINFVNYLSKKGIKTALLTNNFYIDDTKTRTMIVCPLDIFDVVLFKFYFSNSEYFLELPGRGIMSCWYAQTRQTNLRTHFGEVGS